MLFENPPSTGGLMTLSESEILEIQTKLQAIQSAFVPTVNEGVLTTQGLVQRYNDNSANTTKINGDTASMILAYETEQMEGM
ncbi:hypothetical protein QUF88_19185 [Bacillus sp. DX1.1]|uniref:hypothetical protein n=1 Tax=unclassified Bacillus (in: firmicutes) TaxID=185979 RepID=UPI002570EED2|nr:MULTISPECIES: hypothetical protein [unclassified Bacillus (in: firmicutes)]MDM5155836.1 hypothetical protein [Bacillus sp. DX1.1]WJE80133.1 hypothetical protein QRE67_16715 [Bacillus sp. DX3.1]